MSSRAQKILSLVTHTKNTNERPHENQTRTGLKVGDIVNLGSNCTIMECSKVINIKKLSSICLDNPILTSEGNIFSNII